MMTSVAGGLRRVFWASASALEPLRFSRQFLPSLHHDRTRRVGCQESDCDRRPGGTAGYVGRYCWRHLRSRVLYDALFRRRLVAYHQDLGKSSALIGGLLFLSFAVLTASGKLEMRCRCHCPCRTGGINLYLLNINSHPLHHVPSSWLGDASGVPFRLIAALWSAYLLPKKSLCPPCATPRLPSACPPPLPVRLSY